MPAELAETRSRSPRPPRRTRRARRRAGKLPVKFDAAAKLVPPSSPSRCTAPDVAAVLRSNTERSTSSVQYDCAIAPPSSPAALRRNELALTTSSSAYVSSPHCEHGFEEYVCVESAHARIAPPVGAEFSSNTQRSTASVAYQRINAPPIEPATLRRNVLSRTCGAPQPT